MVNPVPNNGPNNPPPASPPPSAPQQGTIPQDSISSQEQTEINNSLLALRSGVTLLEPKLSLSDYVENIADGKQALLEEILAQGLEIVQTSSNSASYLGNLLSNMENARNFVELLTSTLQQISDLVSPEDRDQIVEFNELIIDYTEARDTLNGNAATQGSINWFLDKYDEAKLKQDDADAKYAAAQVAYGNNDTVLGDQLTAQGDVLAQESADIWSQAQATYNGVVNDFNTAKNALANIANDINAVLGPIRDEHNDLVNQFETSLNNIPDSFPIDSFGVSPPDLIPNPPLTAPTQSGINSSGGLPATPPVIPSIIDTVGDGPQIYFTRDKDMEPLLKELFRLNKQGGMIKYTEMQKEYNDLRINADNIAEILNSNALTEGSNAWIEAKFNSPAGASSLDLEKYNSYAEEYNDSINKLDAITVLINDYLEVIAPDYNQTINAFKNNLTGNEEFSEPLPSELSGNNPSFFINTNTVQTTDNFPNPGNNLNLPPVSANIPETPNIFRETLLSKMNVFIDEMSSDFLDSVKSVINDASGFNEDAEISDDDRAKLLDLLKSIIGRGTVSAETFLSEAGGAGTGNAAASVGFASIIAGLANVRLQLVLGNALQNAGAAEFFESIANDTPLYALINEPLAQAIEALIGPLVIAEALRDPQTRDFILNFTDSGSEAESLAALVATVKAIVNLVKEGRIKDNIGALLENLPPFSSLPEGKRVEFLESVGNLVNYSILYAAGQDLAAAVDSPEAVLSKQLIDLVLGENGTPSLDEVVKNSLESGNDEALQKELTDAFSDVLSSGGISGDASRALAIRFSEGLFVADDPLAFIREELSQAGAGQSVAGEIATAALIVLLFPEVRQQDLSLEIARKFSDAVSEEAAIAHIESQRELTKDLLNGKGFAAPLVDQVLGLLGGDRSFASQVASLSTLVDPDTIKELSGSLRDASLITSVSAHLAGDLGDSASQALASFALESINSVENIQRQVLTEFKATGSIGQERETKDFAKELQDEKIGPKNLENYSKLYLAALDSIWGEGLLPHNVNMRTDTDQPGISIAA